MCTFDKNLILTLRYFKIRVITRAPTIVYWIYYEKRHLSYMKTKIIIVTIVQLRHWMGLYTFFYKSSKSTCRACYICKKYVAFFPPSLMFITLARLTIAVVLSCNILLLKRLLCKLENIESEASIESARK